MDTRAEECLIRVDVAYASHSALVEQKRLDWRSAIASQTVEELGSEGIFKRLRSQALLDRQPFLIQEPQDAPELSLVGKHDRPTVVESQPQMLEAHLLLFGPQQQELPGHHQVDKKSPALCKAEPEVLSATIDAVELLTDDQCDELIGRTVTNHSGKLAEVDKFNGGADYTIGHGAADSFDLWKFWHPASIVEVSLIRQPLTEPDVIPATINRCAMK